MKIWNTTTRFNSNNE